MTFLLFSLGYWFFFTRHRVNHGLYGTYYPDLGWKGWTTKNDILDTDISSKTLNFWRAEQYFKQFSIEWNGYIKISETDDYTFFTNSDDGSYLYINDRLVVDNGGPHGLQEAHGTIHLHKGFHKIRIRYSQLGEDAGLEVLWARGNNQKTPIPADVLYPPDTWLAFPLKYLLKHLLLLLLFFLVLILAKKYVPQKRTSGLLSQQSWAILLIVCLLIPFWQSTFALSSSKLDTTYRMDAAGGLYDLNQYVYFYYYLGLFPLVAPGQELIYSREGAQKIVREHPDSLKMTIRTTTVSGDSGKILLFLPAAFLRGDPSDLNVVWINALLFTLALVALLLMAWWQDQLILGILLVAFLGSHPFQLYEIYTTIPLYANGAVGNVFALIITTMIAILALHLPLIFNKIPPTLYVWILPIITGCILGCGGHIRSEFKLIMISVVFCYLTASVLKWKTKTVLILLLLITFFISSRAVQTYFDWKFQQTADFVEKAGGDSYKGPKATFHHFWHPVFTGLSDFGQQYAYTEWDDYTAIRYARPILREHLGDEYPENVSREWFIPGYEDVLKEKIIQDVLNDPGWYLNVLLQRMIRILTDVAPARLGLGAHWLSIPLGGVLLIPTLFVFIYFRDWANVKLVCFSLPLALPAFIIYSGKGMTHYSIYLQIILAILGAMLWDACSRLVIYLKKARKGM